MNNADSDTTNDKIQRKALIFTFLAILVWGVISIKYARSVETVPPAPNEIYKIAVERNNKWGQKNCAVGRLNGFYALKLEEAEKK